MEIRTVHERALDLIARAAVGADLTSVFFPNGEPVPKEGILWDYKRELADGPVQIAELTKDLVAFHNSYGGYIFVGVTELEKDTAYQCCGFTPYENLLQKLNGTIVSLLGSKLDITVGQLRVADKTVLAIHVPRRSEKTKPVSFVRNGPEAKKGRLVVTQGTTWLRKYDETRAAESADDWMFLLGSRRSLEESPDFGGLQFLESLPRALENNLPDRNVICPRFIGRDEILAGLWQWLADDFQFLKLLAGDGGKGKTSIAYEFCSQLTHQPPAWLDQILWLSAKKQQFSAIRNEYVRLPESHYEDVETLVDAICTGAALRPEEYDGASISQRKRLAREALETLPTLIVVDDIDSLSPNEQRRVYEAAQQICSGRSRFLLTARENVAFSSDQCIRVSGLADADFEQFIRDRCKAYQVPPISSQDSQMLRDVTDGSPLFGESVLRLIRLGQPFQSAVKEWRGRSGSDARSAALKKELGRLSTTAKRVLLAVALMRECSFTELTQATGLERGELNLALEQLLALFLVDAPKLIRDEPRFSLSSTAITAVLENKEDLVVDAGAFEREIHRFLGRVSQVGHDKRGRVAAAIRQSMALLQAGDRRKAIETAEATLAVDRNNPDLLMLIGRCYLIAGDEREAAKYLALAHKNGQRKELVFVLWYEAEMRSGNPPGARDVSSLALEANLSKLMWKKARAKAAVLQATARFRSGDVRGATDNCHEASKDLASAIKLSSSEQEREVLRNDLYALHDRTFEKLSRLDGLERWLSILDFSAVSTANGDHRMLIVHHVLTASAKLAEGVDLSADSAASRGARSRLSEARQILHKLKSEMDDAGRRNVERLERGHPEL